MRHCFAVVNKYRYWLMRGISVLEQTKFQPPSRAHAHLGTSTVNRIGTVDQNRGFARRLFIRGSVRTVTVHPR